MFIQIVHDIVYDQKDEKMAGLFAMTLAVVGLRDSSQ
jgi:hypothetical protein